jgi:UPF0755 protein
MRKLIIVLVVLALVAGGAAYWVLFKNNISPSDSRPSLNVPTGSQMSDLTKLLIDKGILQSMQTFELTAQIKGFKTVKPGHYVFNRFMSNREIVNMLQSGRQTPVKLVIYNIRTREEFAGLVGRTLEIDSVAFLAKLNDPDFCAGYNLDTNNILNLFITDNYELKWNTSIVNFTNYMKGYYDKFWNGARRDKAKEMGYNPSQITTLASIVEKECTFDKELPTVAGVYLNRLRIDMPLQADPTLIFATRDFAARRVTQYHKDVESPYNTYQHSGLPPGPICMPKKKSIDAVLNAEQHDYIYFCANPDMSGYSVFSRTLAEQNKIAVEYRKKLNELKVK